MRTLSREGIGYSAPAPEPCVPMPLATRSRSPRSAKAARARKSKTASKPYHHGNLCNALLETAADVIHEQGVAALRLRDLARRLGVSHGAPANHFKDRQELLVALGVQGFQRLTATQRTALDAHHATPALALNAIGVAYVQFARDNPAHFEVMFQRGLLSHPELAQAAAHCFEQLLTAVAAIDPKQGSTVSRSDRELIALGSWALVHGLSTLHVQGLLPGGQQADVAKLTTRILGAMSQLSLRE